MDGFRVIRPRECKTFLNLPDPGVILGNKKKNMNHRATTLAFAALISICLGPGLAPEARSETVPDADKEKPDFFENVGKLFVWKPAKPADKSKETSREKPPTPAPKPKKTAEKKEKAAEESPDSTSRNPFSFLPGLGKKDRDDEKAAAKKKTAPGSASTGPKTKKKKEADPAAADEPAESSAPKKKFNPLGWFGKKETESEKEPSPRKSVEKRKVAVIPVTKPAPKVDPVVVSDPPAASPEPEQKQKPAPAGEPEKKSPGFFGKKEDRKKTDLPDIYEGLSGDEALDLAMKRARAKLEAQGGQAAPAAGPGAKPRPRPKVDLPSQGD